MVIYKTMEVQKKLKELLDKVDAKEQVRIERKKVLYSVIRTDLVEETLRKEVERQVEQRVGTPRQYPVYTDGANTFAEMPEARTAPMVLAEIKQMDLEAKTSVNQDPDYWAAQDQRKQALWDEYHNLKEAA
jgi:fructosamine-3-kinase